MVIAIGGAIVDKTFANYDYTPPTTKVVTTDVKILVRDTKKPSILFRVYFPESSKSGRVGAYRGNVPRQSTSQLRRARENPRFYTVQPGTQGTILFVYTSYVEPTVPIRYVVLVALIRPY